jgi:protein archease
VKFRMLDHTGDLGVVVSGESLSDLFAAAGVLLSQLLTDPSRVREVEVRSLDLQADSPEQLMVAWLNELLYHREVGEFLWRTVEARTRNGTRLAATLKGETFQTGRHVPRRGLKAATYHQLRISRGRRAWSARIIFDV